MRGQAGRSSLGRPRATRPASTHGGGDVDPPVSGDAQQPAAADAEVSAPAGTAAAPDDPQPPAAAANRVRIGREAAAQARESLEAAHQRLQQLQYATARLAAAASVIDVARIGIVELMAITGASSGAVFLADPESAVLHRVTRIGPEKPPSVEARMIDEHVVVLEAFRAGHTVVASGDHDHGYAAGALQRVIALPLTVHGDRVGALSLVVENPIGGVDDYGPAEALAKHVGQSLQRARLYDAEQDARGRAEQLRRTSAAFASASTIRRAAGILAREGCVTVDAGTALVYLLDGRMLRLVAAHNPPAPLTRSLRAIDLDASAPAADAVRRGRPVYLDNRRKVERLYPESQGAGSLAAVPLKVAGQVIGAAVFSFQRPRALSRDSSSLLFTIAQQGAQALDRVRLALQHRQALERERRFQAATAALALASTPQGAAVAAVTLGVPAVGGSRAFIALVEDDEFRTIAPDGQLENTHRGWGGFLLEAPSPVIDAVRDNRPAFLGSPGAIDAAYPALGLARRSFRACAALPLAGADGAIGCLFIAYAARQVFAEPERLMLTRLGEHTAQAIQRGRLLTAERAARRRSELLHEVASDLNTTLDSPAVARALVARVMPAVGAQRAAVVIVTDTDDCTFLAAEGFEDSTGSGPLPAALHLSRRAVQTRGAVVASHASAPPPGQHASSRVTGSAIAVPLTTSDVVFASLVLEFPKPRVIDHDLIDALTTIGRVAGAALERAQAYEHEHRVAQRLQQNLLGAASSPVSGLSVAATYRSAAAALQIGGDWHDVVLLPRGRVLLSVGDVVGHGLEAAAAMGQLRSALASLARVVDMPGRLLEELSGYAETVEGARFATVCCVVVDGSTGELWYACAGHPPPIVVRPDGSATLLWQGRSPPLAVAAPRPQGSVVLPQGSTVLLFTDGLVEFRGRAFDYGLERLRVSAQKLARLATRALPDALMEELLDENQRDDAALLVARLDHVPRPVFHHQMPARSDSLAPMRELIRAWLAGVGVVESVARDMVLAVNEAVANAGEHGYGWDATKTVAIRLALDADQHQVEATVSDTGTWRSEAPGDGRGWGLPTIRAVSDEVVLERRGGGTAITFRRCNH